MNVSKCLGLIQNSQNDSEKFAALLIVAKAVKSNEVDDAERRKLFDAIGFTFINRLLITKEDASGVPQDELFIKIAITLLACFCTDKELVRHSEMINKVPLFVETVQSFAAEKSVSSDEIFDDVLQCVEAMVDEQECLTVLISEGITEALGNVYINKRSKRVFAVLLKLLSKVTLVQQLHNLFQKPGIKLLSLVSHAFKSTQDAFKFELAKGLCTVLQTISSEMLACLFDTQWVSDLRCGLLDILCSKISVEHRRSALCLSSLLCSCIGMEWTIASDTSTHSPDVKFLQLLAHLTEVEVSVILSNSMAEINENSEFLSACYFIVEAAIIYLSKISDGNFLCEDDMLKLHNIIGRTLSTIVKFLEECSTTVENVSSLLTPVILATLRVFGAWFAEDDLTLLSEVCKVLPVVLDIALADHRHNCQSELTSSQQHPHVIQFLLPGLLHLTSEEKPRRAVLRKGKHKVIFEYMMYLIDHMKYHKNGDEEAKLLMCLGVYQNICISERKLLVQDKTFDDIFNFLISCKLMDNDLQPKCILYCALLVSLLITIKYHLCAQLENNKFASIINRIILILYQNCIPLHKSPGCLVKADWDEISEVWMVCFQELTATSKLSSVANGIISNSKQYSKLNDVFRTLQ